MRDVEWGMGNAGCGMVRAHLILADDKRKVSEGRKQRAENRGQKTDNRRQKTEDRKQQRADDRGKSSADIIQITDAGN